MAGRVDWPRALLAAVAAFVAFIATMTLLFGNPVVERVLYTDQAGQSPKVLAMFFEVQPRPAVFWLWDDLPANVGDLGARGAAVEALLFVWALALVFLYAATGWADGPGSVWRRGVGFGVAAWAVVFLFFEAAMPFNMLWEPFALVVIELVLQLVAMVATSVVIASVYRGRAS